MAWGGLVGSDHGDGGGGRAPTSSCALLWLTKHGQRVQVEAVSRGGSGGGVAVVEKRRGRAGVGYGDDGGSRCCGSSAAARKDEGGAEEMKNGGVGWIGRALAMLRPRSGSSLPCWAERWRRVANSRTTRWLGSEPVGH